MDSYGYGSKAPNSSAERYYSYSTYPTPTPYPPPRNPPPQYSYISPQATSASDTARRHTPYGAPAYSYAPNPRHSTAATRPYFSPRTPNVSWEDYHTTSIPHPRYCSGEFSSDNMGVNTSQYATHSARARRSYSYQIVPRASSRLFPEPRVATAADAAKYHIPAGYSLKNWDPTEEPIMLLGSVFDANSLGKWIYDWTVLEHGPSGPTADTAGELWLLLIQLSASCIHCTNVARNSIDYSYGNIHKGTRPCFPTLKHPGRLKLNFFLEALLLLSFLPGSFARAITMTDSPSLDPDGSIPSHDTGIPISPKELAAIGFAILAFSTKATIAYRSQAPDLILTISLLLSLWAYSGVIANSFEDRGVVILPLIWLYSILTSLILALVSIYQVHSRHPLKYALLHFSSQVLISGAMAGVLVANLDSSFNNGANRFLIVIPYCFSLAIFAIGVVAKSMIWVWGKLNTETKEKISGFFSGPLN